jgi:hypothetical protein
MLTVSFVLAEISTDLDLTEYLREISVPEGEAPKPLTIEELSTVRSHHLDTAVYETLSDGCITLPDSRHSRATEEGQLLPPRPAGFRSPVRNPDGSGVVMHHVRRHGA